MLSFIKDRAAKALEGAKSVDLTDIGSAVTSTVSRVQSGISETARHLFDEDHRVGQGRVALVTFPDAETTLSGKTALRAILTPHAVHEVESMDDTVVIALDAEKFERTLAVIKSFNPTTILV